jgi:hypothetical protein
MTITSVLSEKNVPLTKSFLNQINTQFMFLRILFLREMGFLNQGSSVVPIIIQMQL